MWPWKGAYTLGCMRPAWVWGKSCFHSAEGFRSSPAEVEGSLGVSHHPHQLPWALRHGRNLFAAHSQAQLKRNLFLKQSSNPMWHSLALMSWVHFLRWIYKAKSDCISFRSPSDGCGLLQPRGGIRNFPTTGKPHNSFDTFGLFPKYSWMDTLLNIWGPQFPHFRKWQGRRGFLGPSEISATHRLTSSDPKALSCWEGKMGWGW